ncbi:hypothetical protein [Streptomyces sp. NPDC055005]
MTVDLNGVLTARGDAGAAAHFIARASHASHCPIAAPRQQLEVVYPHPDLLDTRDLGQDVTRLQNPATDLLPTRLDAGERRVGRHGRRADRTLLSSPRCQTATGAKNGRPPPVTITS